jgi:hypothetical protein
MDAAEAASSIAPVKLAAYFLAAGFDRFVAAVLAVFALEADFAAVFLAPFLALDFVALDFVALLPALFAALFAGALAAPFAAPFLAPVFFAEVFAAAPFEAVPIDLRAVLPADFDPEVLDEPALLLAFAFGAGVLESPMALPAASFMRVMAD